MDKAKIRALYMLGVLGVLSILGMVALAFAPTVETQFIQNTLATALLTSITAIAALISPDVLRSQPEQKPLVTEIAEHEVKLAQLKTKKAIEEIDAAREEAKTQVRAAAKETHKKQEKTTDPNVFGTWTAQNPQTHTISSPQDNLVYGEPIDARTYFDK